MGRFGSASPQAHCCSPSMLVGMPRRVCIRSWTSRYRWITYASSSSSTNLGGILVSGETFCKSKEVQLSSVAPVSHRNLHPMKAPTHIVLQEADILPAQ